MKHVLDEFTRGFISSVKSFQKENESVEKHTLFVHLSVLVDLSFQSLEL